MAGRRTTHNAAPLPGMPPPEQTARAAPLRVHLDLPPERIVWEITNLLSGVRGIVPVWPFDPALAREGDIILVRVRPLPADGAPAVAGPLPSSRAVALVPEASDCCVLQAARAGAWAVVPEPDLAGGLTVAVGRVADGECPILESVARRPRLAAAVMGDLRSVFTPRPSALPPNPLSRREADMLQLVAEGVTNRIIAERLNLSEQTVKNYLSDIFAKTGSRRRAQAAATAVRRGWLPAK